MANKPTRRLDYRPLKLRAVSLSEGANDEAFNAGSGSALANDAAKIPAVVPPRREMRPGVPPVPVGGEVPRPSEHDAGRRVFTSWQTSSRSSARQQDDDDSAPVAPPPRTRYRFSAALSDEYASAALPPVPALARGVRDPVRTALEIWRSLENVDRTLAPRCARGKRGPGASPAGPNHAVSPAPNIKRPKD